MASVGSTQRPTALELDLHRETTDQPDTTSDLDQNICQLTSARQDLRVEYTPPLSSSVSPKSLPLPNVLAQHASQNPDGCDESSGDLPIAGPSHSQPAGNVPIPPPPNPRRHRSGVLMSRVRANSSGTNFKSGGNFGSRSFGDLNMSMSMSTMSSSRDRSRSRESIGDDDDDEELVHNGSWEKKRVVSEGRPRGTEDDDTGMWDNSARFYHHLHSRPVSRAVSRSTSPIRSPDSPSRATTPSTSTSTSPIYVRRALTLPQNSKSPGPPSSLGLPSTHSPNHQFLQQHLPPTFPASFDGSTLEHAHSHVQPSMVILTPTTQEWRELKEIRRLEGEDTQSSEDTSSGSISQSDGSRRSSLQDDGQSQSSLLFDQVKGFAFTTDRPALKTSMSADFLPEEATHSPDPGSQIVVRTEEPTPDRPRFKSNIISPSPVVAQEKIVPRPLTTPEQEELSTALTKSNEFNESSPEIDQDQIISSETIHRPARFNSIGRRESLRVVKPLERPGVPRSKTKRELERERLFRELDEEIETDAQNEQDTDRPRSASSVQEIGLGGGLSSRPSSADRPSFSSSEKLLFSGKPAESSLIEPKGDIFDRTFEKKVAADNYRPSLSPSSFRANPSSSPTQPIRPSPLIASPVNAESGLPTPDSPLEDPIQGISPKTAPTPAFDSNHAANLDTIRDYARQLASPRLSPIVTLNEASGTSTPSPPDSPRKPKAKGRRRDTNRVSLVAGRVVQPFAIPPSTALPPPERPVIPTNASNPALQSFSPFRSPGLAPTKANGNVPPLFSRFDSTLSLAPSTGAPSECGTPTSETAGGLGGRGIDDYVILKEAGKGAYGLVMRAKVKGPKGEPVGDEVIIKYIIKARILADCWKKHKQLGPIPVEIHVMDQLRHLLYNPPPRPHPWDPSRPRPGQTASKGEEFQDFKDNVPNTPDSPRSDVSSSTGGSLISPTQKYIASEIRHSPERGHPNICKLLDFFEDREFYYLVMPRFGTGVDLFDRVESEPDGLEPFEIRSLLGQLADAVRFLHSNGIVHRDIKDENVILDGNGRCQLIDFGSAAHWRPGKRWDTFSGTLHYASPEILRGVAYGGKEQDIWALGVVAYVLLVGETPFSELPDDVLEGLTPESGAERALEERCGGTHQDEGGEEDGGGRLGDAADLVRRCLENDPAERPSADILCHHRYLRGQGGWTGKKGWVSGGWK